MSKDAVLKLIQDEGADYVDIRFHRPARQAAARDHHG